MFFKDEVLGFGLRLELNPNIAELTMSAGLLLVASVNLYLVADSLAVGNTRGEKLDFNAKLEQELVGSFQRRQAELAELDQKLEERSRQLEKLVRKAEEFTRSPDFLRQVIVNGARRGQSPQALAKATGLSLDEVELILTRQG